MLAHNKSMKDYLASKGIHCVPKRIDKGSLRGTWRLYKKGQHWTDSLCVGLTCLGFRDFDGRELSPRSGNGGHFSVFVRKPKGLEL